MCFCIASPPACGPSRNSSVAPRNIRREDLCSNLGFGTDRRTVPFAKTRSISVYFKCHCGVPLQRNRGALTSENHNHLEANSTQHRTNTASMSATGTFRGTPKAAPAQNPFQDSPSAIPRPKLEPTQSSSDAMSGLSASRAKQSKRDEVRSLAKLKMIRSSFFTRLSGRRSRQISARRGMHPVERVRRVKPLQALSWHSGPVKHCKSSRPRPLRKPRNLWLLREKTAFLLQTMTIA